jgi:hypothetical protein
VDAVHEGGGRRGPQAAALDLLCELAIGLPIQEARDHVVIKLEYDLRDGKHRHTVTGIVLPHNADSLFRLPVTLVARMYHDYQTSTRYHPSENFYDRGVSSSWASLSPSEREDCVSQAISSGSEALGLKHGDVRVVECNRPYAATIGMDGSLPVQQKRAAALAIERIVRAHCDPRLEIFCEEKKDLSKIRRELGKEVEL